MKKKFSRVIAHHLPQCLLLFSILTSNVLFPATVIAQEIENTNNVTQEETVPIDTSEDILEEGISTSIYEEEEVVEPLFVFENGIYTVNTVVEGEEYVYPDNNNVRVKFTEVTQEGNLIIKRVELTQEQKELLNTKDNYGWDITSSMENGTFKYTLTLPNIYDNTNVEVKYTEDGNNYNSIQSSSINNNRIVIEGLDHFTLFVTTQLKDDIGIAPGGEDTIDCPITIKRSHKNGITCFFNIQKAIEKAEPGETIIVKSGKYNENIDINKDKITIISADGPEKTAIIGTGGEDPVVKFSSNGSTLEGFTIDNTKGERAIAPQASLGTNIKNNIIINSVRGIQGDFNGRPKDLTITDNIFDSTVSYGIAGTEEVTDLLVTGNAFKTLVEGIGLGAGVTLKEEKTIKDLLEINKFDLAGGYAIGDYRAGTLQPIKYTVNGYLLVENGDSIQKVIDVSSNGDTIQVGTGIFDGGIVINKSITLKNGSLPRIDCRGSGVGITVNAPNVTIDGFEITNCNIGIRSYGGPSNLGSLTINNSKIYKNTENGILLVNDTFETVNLNNLSIYENGGNGIGLGQITVTKNINAKSLVIEKSNYHGLFISESTIENLDVVNSVFRKSQTSGYSGITIGTKKSTINNLSIDKTTFNDNKGAGISIIQAAHQIQTIHITNSEFIQNNESGVVFGGGSSSKTVNITDSVFQSNNWEDIDLTGGWWGGFTVTTSADISKNNFLSQTGNKIYIGSSGLINKVKISNNNFYGTGVAVYNENSTTTPDLDSNWWNTFNNPSGRVFGKGEYTYWLCQPYQTTWISQNGECKLNAPQNLGWNVSSLTNNPGQTPVKLSCGSFTNDNTPSHVWTSVPGNNIKYQRQAKAPSGGWWTDPNVYTNTYTPFTYFGQSGQGNGWEGEWNSRVRAFYDENGNGVYDDGEMTSDWSDECTITYDNTAPSIPSNLSYTVNGQPLSCGSYTNIYNVRANWSASSDNLSEIDHYEYQSFNPPNGWIWPNDNSGVSVSTTHREGAFTVGEGTYGFRVRAVDKAGNKSDWSSTDFSNSCKITYDIKAPIANILSHKDGDWIKGTTTITGQITDVNLMRYWFVIQNTLGVQVGGYGTQTVYTSPISLNYPWNTSILADGQYIIKLEARDLANNKNPDPVSYDPNIDSDSIDWVVVNVDNTAPAISNIKIQKNGTTAEYVKKGDKIVITANVIDSGSGVKAVSADFSYNSAYTTRPNPTSISMSKVGSTDTYKLEFTIPNEWNEGDLYITVAARDNLDNYNSNRSSAIKILNDNTKPTIEILSPDANSVHKGNLEIQVKGSDANGLNQFVVNLYKTGQEGVVKSCVNKNMNGALEGTVTCTINTASYTDGSYYIKTNVKDLAGNMSQTLSRTFIFDNTAPTGSITSIYYPIKNVSVLSFITNDNTPILEGTCSDTNIDTVKLTIGSEEQILECIYNKWRANEPTTQLSDGKHTITVTITDTAGNHTVTTQDIIIDTVLPTAEYKYYKGDQEITDSIAYAQKVEDLSFTARYSDKEPSSELYQDSFVIFEAQDDGSFGFSRNGKKSFCGWRNDPNKVSLSGTTYKQESKVPFTKCISSLEDGEYYLAHQLYDSATREDIPTINQFRDIVGLHFIIDSTAPITTLSSDPSNTFVNQPVLISGQSTDINGVDSVNIFYRVTGKTDWTLITTLDNNLNNSPYYWEYIWTPSADGTYDIKVSATDIVGNIEESAYIYALTYDITPPTITVFSIVSNILNISASDLLSGTDKVEVKINDGEWITYTADINLNTLLSNIPGTYTIYARVTDKAGNTTQGSTIYTIPQPTPAATTTETTTEGQVLGATTTTKTTTKKTTTTALATTQDTDTTTEEIVDIDTSIKEKSVLGAATCENKKKVSGYVYIDENKDKEMNDNEKGIKDITITIQYTDEEGNIKTEEEVSTDEKGYWETQLCSGKYNIVVKQDTLPKNIEVPEVLSLTVSDNEKETIFNIQALDTRNFWQKYWYLIVGGLAIIVIGYSSIKNRKKEEI